MNKEMQKLLKAINDKKNEVKSLANDGKLEKAKAAKDELKALQERFNLLCDLEDDALEGIKDSLEDGTANVISGEKKPEKKNLVKAFVNIVKAGFMGTKVNEEDATVYKNALTSDATAMMTGKWESVSPFRRTSEPTSLSYAVPRIILNSMSTPRA